MLLALKIAMIRRGIRQTRMAVELGWDPAKLSRIVNQIAKRSAADEKAIASYLGEPAEALFSDGDAGHPDGKEVALSE